MRRARPRQKAEPAMSQFVHRPFKTLDTLIAKPATRPRAQPARPPQAPVATAADSERLFRDAVAGVRPLNPRARERVAGTAPAASARTVTHPDAEALAELCDLVEGSAPFDISDTDEHIEGAMVGLDPRLLRRLRRGEFASQGHLDLHGLTSEEARRAVDSFLLCAHRDGKRCVLIIHGRGHNSKDQMPVLKSRLTTWLAHGAWARLVLAFTSARACDGGAGALYVLLRRQRHRKQPMRVTVGAKW